MRNIAGEPIVGASLLSECMHYNSLIEVDCILFFIFLKPRLLF